MILQLRACLVDLDQLQILRDGTEQSLTATEARLLRFLASRAGQIVPQDVLLQEVWAYSPKVVSRTVTTTVARLRAKIERDPAVPDHLITKTGEGYALFLGHQGRSGPFVGRHALQGELAAVESRLIALRGPSGIGKTRLAEEWVSAELRAGRPAVLVELAGARTEPQTVALVGTALGVSAGSGGALGHALAEQGPLLLVLDNVEQVVQAVAPLVSQWLAVAPDLRVVATTQIAMDLDEEHVVDVPFLDEDAAVELLAARGRVVRSSFAIPPAAQALAREVVRSLGCLPLAIELAAGWLDVLDLAGLKAQLARRLDLEASDSRPQRHVSLRAALDHSMALLEPEVQQILIDLSVFEGSFDAGDASAVASGSVLAAVRRLKARSWLRGDARVALLPAPKEYLRERLSDATRARHLAYFADIAAAGELRSRHLPDVRQAVRHGARAQADVAAELALSVGAKLFWGAPASVRVEVLSLAHDAVDDLPIELATRLRCELGVALGPVGRYQEGGRMLQRAIADGEAHGLQRWTAVAWTWLAGHGLVSNPEDSEPAIRTAVELCEPLGGVELAWALRYQGRWLLIQGRFADAAQSLGRAIALAERVGHEILEVGARQELTGMHLLANEPQQALDVADAALARAEHPERWLTLGQFRADALQRVGRVDEAIEALQENQRLAARRGLVSSRAAALGTLGMVYHRQNDPDNASRYVRQGLQLARAIQSPRQEGIASFLLARVHLAAGEPAEAAEHIQFALEHLKEGPRTLGQLTEIQARCRHLAGDLDGALTAYRTAAEAYAQAELSGDRIRVEVWASAAQRERGGEAAAPQDLSAIPEDEGRAASRLLALAVVDPQAARDLLQSVEGGPPMGLAVALSRRLLS